MSHDPPYDLPDDLPACLRAFALPPIQPDRQRVSTRDCTRFMRPHGKGYGRAEIAARLEMSREHVDAVYGLLALQPRDLLRPEPVRVPVGDGLEAERSERYAAHHR